MSLLEPERFWSEPLDRRLEAVRNLRLVDHDVAASPHAPAEALAEAFTVHLSGLAPEEALGSDAFGPWARFQADVLGVQRFDAAEIGTYADILRRLVPAEVAGALGLLRRVADLAEDSVQRQRHDFFRYDDR